MFCWKMFSISPEIHSVSSEFKLFLPKRDAHHVHELQYETGTSKSTIMEGRYLRNVFIPTEIVNTSIQSAGYILY